MARINIEESFWGDVGKVAAKIGNYHQAIGMAVHLFRFAQDRYKNGRIVSDEDWVREGFHDALIGVFAEKVDGGFSVIGAEKQFGWLKKRAVDAANAGRISASTRRSKNNNLVQRDSTKTNPLSLPLEKKLKDKKSPDTRTGNLEPFFEKLLHRVTQQPKQEESHERPTNPKPGDGNTNGSGAPANPESISPG